MNIDHIVLWVEDPNKSLAFYSEVLGLMPVRAEEYRQGKVPFPSLRLNKETIIDLMALQLLPFAREATGADAGGKPMNHVCLNTDQASYKQLKTRLADAGIIFTAGTDRSFGAQGYTGQSGYFADPDGNIVELRCYD